VSGRQSYKSDSSDERWALIEPVITSWKARHPSVSGHQSNCDMLKRLAERGILAETEQGLFTLPRS
jgi:hypothetical protein